RGAAQTRPSPRRRPRCEADETGPPAARSAAARAAQQRIVNAPAGTPPARANDQDAGTGCGCAPPTPPALHRWAARVRPPSSGRPSPSFLRYGQHRAGKSRPCVHGFGRRSDRRRMVLLRLWRHPFVLMVAMPAELDVVARVIGAATGAALGDAAA